MSDRATPWLAIARYDAAGRARGTVVLTGLLSSFLLVFLAFFPSLATADVDLDAYVEAFPPAVREAFGIIAISSIEGFLAVEFYQFAWLLLVGLYLAYLAGGTIAGDIASGRMDLTLSAPVARRDVVIGRFLGLVPLVVLLNVVLPVVAYVGVVAVGETIAVERLAAVHALAVPYHVACVAAGIAVSTLLSRPGVAQRVALGGLFALFMFDSLVASTDYAAAGNVSPTAHYDPSAVLVLGEYDLTGAAVLLAATAVLLAIAIVRFRRADLSG
ncbi:MULTISPECIES: ABC transporter permease subunit [Halorubrum]|jgi:ABC-2 type transport system permease protein|uniref:ABC transporter permease n=1 Tax=Halorubrum ezzemoulense TaxID=337243 RepID=A0A256J8J7_HALEZ|nr:MULTISPECIES: ABC transporter permease subunit [Halorubrum]MDB2237235.1 ABC transporter permease subunit [Halorubrum ezzemoulense]MDB2241712.1 ABC transporter permease subunit [Halorubrum ezzemoulense]MDB2246815.1 ABC transporter permease subunit [Halorubrum ezzemoulense]MDB2259963.1 ABC transporter permease subunit [Halorubrum ezzemoulense]MDB2266803.1 ABC transporter permease subunit [Halorubrum ezzemoulense]